jgi:hypothetical protein
MLNEAERIARAHRGKVAFEEFFEPMLGELQNAYSERLVEVANSELNPANRADKITALSNALKILNNLEAGMKAIVTDGEIAMRDKARTDKIEQMTAPQQRLLGVVPH